jgi:hypothetical protein
VLPSTHQPAGYVSGALAAAAMGFVTMLIFRSAR